MAQRRRIVGALAVFVALTVEVVAPRVRADAGDVARAEVLFREGTQLMASQKFDVACPKLEESQRLAPGIGVALHLGECYEHVGRTASAQAQFRPAEAVARARADGRAD